jgi:hypothetical protein
MPRRFEEAASVIHPVVGCVDTQNWVPAGVRATNKFWAIRTRKCGWRRYRLVNGARGGKNRLGDWANGKRGVAGV